MPLEREKRERYQNWIENIYKFSLRKCEEKLKREKVKLKERGRVADKIKEGDSTYYSVGPSDLKHCQDSSALKEDKTGENTFENKIIPELIRKPV